MLYDDLPKHGIRHIGHRRQNEKRLLQLSPKSMVHNNIIISRVKSEAKQFFLGWCEYARPAKKLLFPDFTA